jgi:hypothetical protein
MKEIGMFEYDPVFGSFSYPSSSREFDTVTVIAEGRILRTLKPKGDRGSQEETQGTALPSSSRSRHENVGWIGSGKKRF